MHHIVNSSKMPIVQAGAAWLVGLSALVVTGFPDHATVIGLVALLMVTSYQPRVPVPCPVRSQQ